MPLRMYNTRTRRKATLTKRGDVRMYVCGPTVYAATHMGHARSYVAFDVIRRYLEFRGHPVRLVVNITDVEDTITNRAQDLGVPWRELADRYAEEFLEDLRALNARDADAYPRVTDHVAEIQAVARDLLASGRAYEVDGSVYLDTAGGGFGALSHRNPEDAIVGEPQSGPRRHPLDFAIWKKEKPGGPAWDSPWGRGYPGWHVECYAMATKHLGRVDVHGGGQDLIHPHHESENLIARAHAGRDFASRWMHNGWLTLEWEKMSKSLGNVVPVRDVLREWPGEVVRLCLAKAHYREDVEYDRDCFKQTAEELAGIRAGSAHVATLRDGPPNPGLARLVEHARESFLAAMDDDFDTNAAYHAVRQLAEALLAFPVMAAEDRERVSAAMGDFGDVFGVSFG